MSLCCNGRDADVRRVNNQCMNRFHTLMVAVRTHLFSNVGCVLDIHSANNASHLT